MTKLGLFGAAAVILSSALASPVMAQQVISDPGYCAQFYPNANCENKGPGNPYTGDYQRRSGWGSNPDYWNDGWHDSWNDNSAPFRDDSYTYYNNGYSGAYGDTYARSWFVCQPGTFFRGEDGRRHICQ
jgi:hypothetical protein